MSKSKPTITASAYFDELLASKKLSADVDPYLSKVFRVGTMNEYACKPAFAVHMSKFSRRDFLKFVTVGLGSLTLSQFLAACSQLLSPAASAKPRQPASPLPPTNAPLQATGTQPPATSTPQPIATSTATPTITSFRFISLGDSHDLVANVARTDSQAAALNPAFTIFNGDLENDGVVASDVATMTGAFSKLFPGMFLVRGNHDNELTGSAARWENYFASLNRPLPAGVTNYTPMDPSSAYLTYSFDYGNSRFIGLDVPGDSVLVTAAELTFLDSRLTDAESRGLINAFIFFHGPEYGVESINCLCKAVADDGCTPMAFIDVINKHPIVTATFHGHDHILGWVHMDSHRVQGLTHPYEEFLTSPAGGWSYNQYMYPDRVDYYYPDMGTNQGFATVDVDGSSFTVSFYKDRIIAPVWSRRFNK